MCKAKRYKRNPNNRIDKCMVTYIENLRLALQAQIKIVACCCGHNKYPMTIVINAGHGIYDLISGEIIPRKRNFYKRDKQGYYYIPEVSKCVS